MEQKSFSMSQYVLMPSVCSNSLLKVEPGRQHRQVTLKLSAVSTPTSGRILQKLFQKKNCVLISTPWWSFFISQKKQKKNSQKVYRQTQGWREYERTAWSCRWETPNAATFQGWSRSTMCDYTYSLVGDPDWGSVRQQQTQERNQCLTTMFSTKARHTKSLL